MNFYVFLQNKEVGEVPEATLNNDETEMSANQGVYDETFEGDIMLSLPLVSF